MKMYPHFSPKNPRANFLTIRPIVSPVKTDGYENDPHFWPKIPKTNLVLRSFSEGGSEGGFKQALSKMQLVRWNHVYGDVDGNIFYIWNGRIFHRQGDYDYTRPVDGSTSKTEWGELVQMYELPQETNPESKFFQNCNTAPWFVNPRTTIKEEDYPSYIANGGFNARGIRSTNLLDRDWDIKLNEMMAYSLDNFALNAEILIPPYPQLIGAIGAALFALEKYKS